MLRLEIDTTPLIREIEQITARANDVRPHAPTIFGLLQDDVQERFETAPGVRETAVVHGGAVWESLSDRYLARRPDREGGRQLVDTTKLKDSFVVGDLNNIATATADSIEFGSEVVYAAPQDRRRPILFLHDDLVSLILDTTADYVLYGSVL